MKKTAREIVRGITGKDYHLTSKNVSFSDLARGGAIFITIHGWNNGAMFTNELEAAAHKAGFIFNFEY